MSLWARLKSKLTDAGRGYPSVHGDKHMAVVGESFHRSNIARTVGTTTGTGEHEFEALLRREPRNPHDPNAIAVIINYRRVGFLSRERAASFAKRIDELGGCVACRAIVRREDPDRDWNIVLRVNYKILDGHEDPKGTER